MRRIVLVAALALTVGAVSTFTQGQAPNRQPQDVQALLQAAAKNMGAENMKTLEYKITGMIAAPGQGFDPVPARLGDPEHWPRFVVTNYTKTIDFGTMSAREQYTRTPPQLGTAFPGLDSSAAIHGNQSDPPFLHGGGFIQDPTPRQIDSFANGKVAWDMNGTTAARQWSYLNGIDAAEFRQLDILLNPFGFLHAALAPGANPKFAPGGGRGGGPARVEMMALGKYRVIGTINQNLVTDVQTWIPVPISGDMRVSRSYTRWKNFGDLKYYTDVHSHYFDNGEQDDLQYRVLDAKANVAVPANMFAVPAAVQAATRPAVTVQATKLADGVWLMGGGSHNSVAIEFRDFVTVVEAPLNDERSQAVIAEVHKTIPNKPIRYVVNTHYHWDHSGGLRGYVAEGAQIITHQENVEYYEKVLGGGSHKLMPDTLSKREEATEATMNPRFVPVSNAPFFLTDHAFGSEIAGGKVMEIYYASGGSPAYTSHSEQMLVVYLPADKILINADLYTPPAAGVQLRPFEMEGVVALGQIISQNKLNVGTHVPVHGQPGTQQQFAQILGGRVPPNSHGPLILPTPTSSSATR